MAATNLNSRYVSKKPCKRGHAGERYFSNNNCVQCSKERILNWRKNNLQEHRNYRRKYNLIHFEQVVQYMFEWRQVNKQQRRKYRMAWLETNYEKSRIAIKKWKKNNKGKVTAYTVKRKVYKLKACPAWVDLGEIERIYISCPKGYQVDHIVPLINDKVCGLHVPWNLQYLTAKDNAVKGNKFNFERKVLVS
jgi:hypothetical protein